MSVLFPGGQAAMTIRQQVLEERRARDKLRAVERARKAKERQAKSYRAEIIRQEKARRTGCTCPITSRTTVDELQAMGSGCTAGQYVCPTLDAIRRRLGR